MYEKVGNLSIGEETGLSPKRGMGEEGCYRSSKYIFQYKYHLQDYLICGTDNGYIKVFDAKTEQAGGHTY